jgi:hypothetical protein
VAVFGNARVVEHVQRKGDDGLEPVVLDHPAADVALALAGIAGEPVQVAGCYG